MKYKDLKRKTIRNKTAGKKTKFKSCREAALPFQDRHGITVWVIRRI